MKNENTSLFQKELVQEALKESFVKLNPKIMFRNPVMFTVEIGTFVMLVVTIYSLISNDQGSFGYNLTVFLLLLLTLLFANFAEAIAEARGKAQADSLRKTREETPAKKVAGVGKDSSRGNRNDSFFSTEKRRFLLLRSWRHHSF